MSLHQRGTSRSDATSPRSTPSEYAEWAVGTYESWIEPLLAPLREPVLEGSDPSLWLDVCGPGDPHAPYRLFPGALFLLWVEALVGDEAIPAAAPIAAAVELLHNATLVHDDVLDGHSLRKGQPTIWGQRGQGVAVLAGDALWGSAISVLAGVAPGRLPGCLARLGRAVVDVAAGQLLDEPAAWARVAGRDQWAHWLAVCQGKLAIGSLGGPLAAYWSGNDALESALRVLLDEYSVVSQIINDFGDVMGFAGYHVKVRSRRPANEESRRKPTLPVIWAGGRDPNSAAELARLVAMARTEIASRKRQALAALEKLPLRTGARGRLRDFFASPSLPDVGEVIP